jgi:hypothetical protein
MGWVFLPAVELRAEPEPISMQVTTQSIRVEPERVMAWSRFSIDLKLLHGASKRATGWQEGALGDIYVTNVWGNTVVRAFLTETELTTFMAGITDAYSLALGGPNPCH